MSKTIIAVKRSGESIYYAEFDKAPSKFVMFSSFLGGGPVVAERWYNRISSQTSVGTASGPDVLVSKGLPLFLFMGGDLGFYDPDTGKWESTTNLTQD